MVHVRRLLNIVDIFGQYFLKDVDSSLIFLSFFAPFPKMKYTWLKMDKKSRLQPYFSAIFCPLLFGHFFATFSKME